MSGLIRLTGQLFNFGSKLWLADQSLLCNIFCNVIVSVCDAFFVLSHGCGYLYYL